MTLLGVVFGVVGFAVLIAAAWIMAWSGGPPLIALTYGTALITPINIILFIWSVVIAIFGGKLPRSADKTVWIPVGVGAFATVYEASNVWSAMLATHTTNLMVVGPGFSASLPPLGFGLIASGIAIVASREHRPAD